MTLLETIIRVIIVIGLSYPFWRFKDANTKISSEEDIRKKGLMRFVWIHILMYSIIIQIWVLIPLVNGVIG